MKRNSITRIIKRPVVHYAFCFLLVFSSAFLSTITKFSPVFIALFLALLLYFTAFSHRAKIQTNSANRYIFLIVLVYFLYIVCNFFYTASYLDIYTYATYLLCNQFYFIGILIIGSKLSKKTILKYSKNYLFISAIFLTLDLIYRFYHAKSSYKGYFFFYNFKSDSLMFPDSNITGFLCMINFAFIIYLSDCFNQKNRMFKLYYFILSVLTFSRAALLSEFLVLAFSFLKKKTLKTRFYIILFTLPFIIALTVYLFRLLLNDPSFDTKIEILSSLKHFIKHVNASMLIFGNGLLFLSTPEAKNLAGGYVYFGHLYLVSEIVGIGILGLFIELFIFFVSGVYSKWNTLYLIIPFLAAGLSAVAPTLSYFYALLGVQVLLSRKGLCQTVQTELNYENRCYTTVAA